MTFGGHDYGPVDDNEDESSQSVVSYYDEDDPSSIQQCDHPNCKQPTSEARTRICSECTLLMHAETPNECERCGATIHGGDDRST